MIQKKPFNINSKNRIWELDFIRGFCILLMIIDHTLYDLAFIFKDIWFEQKAFGFWYWLCNLAKTGYFTWILRNIIWGIAVFLFIFISGISCSFSHSNLKRGIRLAVVSILLTAFTWGMDWFMGQHNQYIICFGILHMLATSILLYCLLSRLGQIPMFLIGVFAIVIGIYFSYNPLEASVGYLAVLVHTTGGFYSADYFPLLPWFGYFLIGATLGPLLYQDRCSFFPQHGKEGWMRPILFTGRHSLIFYLLHQPVIYALLTLIGLIFL